MNILITGTAGFIGSHVSEHFLAQGHDVVGIDNFDPYYDRSIKEENSSISLKNTHFHFYEKDIRDAASMTDIMKKHSTEVVIHLAAKAGVRPSLDAVALYYDVNINGTISLLESMRANGITKMLFASSSSVYGNNEKVPFSENDNVDYPISPYASTKKSGELLCHTYHHLHGFDITCLRFFTVFGPRQRPDLAIHKFTRLIEQGKSIPFYGDGSASRDYTYIEDILNGIHCAFNHLSGYNIFNLGESRVITLSELVNTLEEVIGKKANLDRQPLQPGDVNVTYADISRARTEIGYQPRFNFREGIIQFYEWYKTHSSR
jgi:UDP-glucuronate 4-epimerase